MKDTPDPKDSFVVGVDQRTGAVRWKTPRKTDTTSYSVPFLRRGEDGQEEIVCCSTAEGFFALDPRTGKEKWFSKVFDKRTVSSPFQAGSLIFGTTGSGGGGNYVVALQPGANPKVVYEVRKEAPYVPAPIARGELLFLWSDKGIVTCINLADGAMIWQKRVNGGFSIASVRTVKLLCWLPKKNSRNSVVFHSGKKAARLQPFRVDDSTYVAIPPCSPSGARRVEDV
jgi:outer membrane protein assembly factor BamB